MASTLDALATLYRLLILVSATVLAIAGYYDPNPYPFTEASETVQGVATAYSEFVAEIRKDATVKYRSQILPLAADRQQSEREIVEHLQFVPYSVTIVNGNVKQPFPIGDTRIPLNAVLLMSMQNDPTRGNYPTFKLDPKELMGFLDWIISTPDLRRLYPTGDLLIYLVPPGGGDEGFCALQLRSSQWEKTNFPRYQPVKCKKLADEDISELLRGFRGTAWGYGYAAPWQGKFYKLGTLPLPLAAKKLDTLAKKETVDDEKIEFLGPKLKIGGVLNIGPILIIAILLLMLVHTRNIRLLPEDKPGDGAGWFGLFVGWLPLSTAIPVFVLLPTIATAMALDAGYEPPFGLPMTLPWWDPRLLWAQRWFVGGTLFALCISIWLLAANIRAARAWRARLTAAKAASWEA